MNIKELKKQILKQTYEQPEKFFPVNTLKEKGFERKKCGKCRKFFWSVAVENFCGDCEPYSFIGMQQTKKKMNYIETAKAFSNSFDKLGYRTTERYPVVARWRDDITFVHAAINNYQPYVVSGEVEPPANPLNVIQPSLRFNDIENVGITGRHLICHFHAEQFGVFKKSEYNKDKYLSDLLYVLEKGLTLPLEKIKLHEDSWGGGGNLGVSLEHFLRGLELGNQVYMTERVTETGYEPLPVGVLDMGAGLERYAWVATDNPSMYDNTMPTACDYLYKQTGVNFDKQFMAKFMPHGGQFNLDEIQDVERAWKDVASKLKMSVDNLQSKIIPISSVFSLADISRTLLFAINDGALPSNTGGNYNLRFIYRRALGFIDKYGWDIDFNKLFELHANYLSPLMKFENIDDVQEIIKHEEQKYKESLSNARKKIEVLVAKQSKFSVEQLKTLYESDGITPEMLQKVKPDIEVPKTFYSEVAEKQEESKQNEIKEYYEVEDVPETEALWHTEKLEFDAEVYKTIKQDEKIFVILNRTAFYPNMGGQASDTGLLNNTRVIRVFNFKNRVLHEVETQLPERVTGKVNKARRVQLMKHHTGTHILNGAARKILGNHIWQAGAEKTVEKGRLDITHFENISDEQLKQIEKLANDEIKKSVQIEIKEYDKQQAEKIFGFRIYQGGAVPGNKIRIVNIPDFDVEACGGTHFKNTNAVEQLKVLRAKKIQDGVVRLEFVAGFDLIRETEKQLQREKNETLKSWMKKIQDIENERLQLKGKPILLGLLPNTEEGMFELFKKVTKDLEKLKENQVQSIEPVQFISQPDMRLLQSTAEKILKQHDHCFLVAPGMVYSYGEKTKRAAEKAAQLMGGKVGQKGAEFKGGGPNTEKAREAFEEARKLI